MTSDLHLTIMKAIVLVGVKFDEAVVEEIVRKVTAAKPRHLIGYAHATAYHWAVDQRRKEARAARRKAEEIVEAEQKRQRDEEDRQEKMLFDQARADFWSARKMVMANPGKGNANLKMTVIYATLFEGRNGEEVAAEHGLECANVYQLCCRGTKLLMPHASPALRTILLRRTKHG